jgi:hypothetical protein
MIDQGLERLLPPFLFKVARPCLSGRILDVGCGSEALAALVDACIVVTTLHPSVDWVDDVVAAVGLFSKHAKVEYEDLLDRAKLEIARNQASLKLVFYQRFSFGVNQIAAYAKDDL